MVAFYLLLVFLSAPLVLAAYRLVDNYTPQNFLNNFVFDNSDDPTNGYVNYLTREQAKNRNLTKIVNNRLYIGTDYTHVVGAKARGRDSVRIYSKKAFTHGLFILDLQHMPGGQCGSWPAFWFYDVNDWPTSGEIDVIEGVNTQNYNAMAMHTVDNCSINEQGNFSGSVDSSNCFVNATGQPKDSGCSISTDNTQTYGTGYNKVQGGVYAVQWTSSIIKIWFFRRSKIPTDITNGKPRPGSWTEPLAAFSGACDLDSHVFNQRMTFDLAFCGDWAGDDWKDSCKNKAKTCKEYVKNNPHDFKDAYWLINSLKVYQN
uniref:Beta 1,3 (4)-glucanase n=1 Tax=Aphelenchoides besseyi TaxID=269767 RepID=A0A1V0JAM6_9BILA|nr:beta 1,3 (4)-glucanase [Aphelenchoides besseyi]